MAYFAELDNDNTVLRVVSIGDQFLLDENGVENETTGIAFCHQLWGENTCWVQTSYNTYQGQHKNGKTPLRKNYAAMGNKYDADRDAFIPPKPEGDSWVFDENRCIWVKIEE